MTKAYAITDDKGEITTFFRKGSNMFQRRVYKDKETAKGVLKKIEGSQFYKIIEVYIIPNNIDQRDWCPCCGAELPPNHILKK